MKLILDLATILGGIAALCFFWDRLSSYRKTLLRKATSPPKNSVRYLDTNRPFYRITPISIGISGIVIFVIGITVGWEYLERLILAPLVTVVGCSLVDEYGPHKQLHNFLLFVPNFLVFVGIPTSLIGQGLGIIGATLFIILATIGSVWLMIWLRF